MSRKDNSDNKILLLHRISVLVIPPTLTPRKATAQEGANLAAARKKCGWISGSSINV